MYRQLEDTSLYEPKGEREYSVYDVGKQPETLKSLSSLPSVCQGAEVFAGNSAQALLHAKPVSDH